MKMDFIRRTWAEIDLDALDYNIKSIKAKMKDGQKVMGIVKADCYGHGDDFIARKLDAAGFDWFGVSNIEEGMSLRTEGITKPILILGYTPVDCANILAEQKITQALIGMEYCKALQAAAEKAGVVVDGHIKLDTGMGRIGFPISEESVECIERISKLEHVVLEGMFTHFAKADETDKTYTKMQHEKFVWMQRALLERAIEIPYLDCDNSAGIIDFPDLKHDLARAGISLYGMYPSDEVNQQVIDLKPALELISHISFVKEVEAGTAISYGGTFVAPKKMRVATIPVGYGDGYPRSLSNKADVLIRGKRARILGRVCMDQFMADVTDIPKAAFMDQVILVGADGEEHISVEELSELSGRFPYEFVCCLSKRIPRVYIRDGKVTIQKDCF